MAAKPDTMPTPSRKMLGALNYFYRRGNLHLYGGTVPAADVAKTRAKNRAARKQRRVNRLRSK